MLTSAVSSSTHAGSHVGSSARPGGWCTSGGGARYIQGALDMLQHLTKSMALLRQLMFTIKLMSSVTSPRSVWITDAAYVGRGPRRAVVILVVWCARVHVLLASSAAGCRHRSLSTFLYIATPVSPPCHPRALQMSINCQRRNRIVSFDILVVLRKISCSKMTS